MKKQIYTTKNDYTVHHYTFTSWRDWLSKAKEQSYLWRAPSSRITGNRNGFCHHTSFEEAVKTATFGWPLVKIKCREYISKARTIFEAIIPKEDYGLETTKDVTGEYLDTVTLLTGDPNCMVRYKPSAKITTGTKLQNIVVNCCFDCMVTQEQVLLYGIFVMGLSEALDLAGYNTQIIIRYSLSHLIKHGWLVWDINLKDFSENTDVDRLAFCVANVDNLRRLGFSFIEGLQEVKDSGPNYSSPGGGTYGVVSEFKECLRENTIYIPQLDNKHTMLDIENIFRTVVKSLNEETLTE